MPQQSTADTRPLRLGAHVGVADEVHVLHRLHAHDAHQFSVALEAPEHHAGADLFVEFVIGHVRLVPAVRWDDATIALRRLVDDGEDRGPVLPPA
jgi:hypothetical protein